MNAVKVNRQELLKRVKANRDKHEARYQEAKQNFRKAVEEELMSMLDDARTGKPLRLSVRLTKPERHTKEYEQTIDMLEMSTDEALTISAHEFNCYARDEWPWHDSFVRSTGAYLAGGRAEQAQRDDEEDN